MAFGAQAFARLGFGRVGIFVRIDVVRRSVHAGAEAEAVTRSAEQKKQKQAKRKQAKPQQDAQAPRR